VLVIVTYDVSTTTAAGRRRLTRVARTCQSYGQRVQKSVFECMVDPEQWAVLRHRLVNEIDPEHDSLRFYFLGSNWDHRVEHMGANRPLDPRGPLVA
jgi:CRISPR-associated protein Cas2